MMMSMTMVHCTMGISTFEVRVETELLIALRNFGIRGFIVVLAMGFGRVPIAGICLG